MSDSEKEGVGRRERGTNLNRERTRIELEAEEGDVGEDTGPCAAEGEGEELGDDLCVRKKGWVSISKLNSAAQRQKRGGVKTKMEG